MNYYEMLGLPCEGKEVDNIGLITTALAEWCTKMVAAINNETNKAAKVKLEEEYGEYANMQKLATDKTLRTTHADALRDERLKQADTIINMLNKSSAGTKSIARPRVEKLAESLGLQSGTLTAHFISKGYTVETYAAASTNDFLMRDTEFDEITKYFKSIKEHMAQFPAEQLQEIANATNLYEYIAIMDGKSIAAAKDYEAKTTPVLCALFGEKMAIHTGNAALSKLYRSIESKANASIMRNDSQREKYNNTLRLQQLIPWLKELKPLPDTVKLEHAFASECIKEIQVFSFDESQAIAIYNKYVGTQYEKENTSIATMCSCHILNFHNTREDAIKAKCVSCGQPLYDICPECKKKVPAISEFCTCGFFMKGRSNFTLHFKYFNDAIKLQNLPLAKDELYQAQASDPSDSRLAAMEATLKKLEAALGNDLKEIESALNAKMPNEAQDKINALKSKIPTANVESYQKQVNVEIAWANNEYAQIERAASLGRQVEIASGITDRVKDHRQALDWLRSHAPKPVKNVKEAVNIAELTCALKWENDPDNRFVTYTVVRKEGGIPESILDGTQVAADLNNTAYRDEGLSPGKIYYYAVFAVRGGSASAAAPSSPVCLLKNIDEVKVNISGKTCTFSWNDVRGSKGVSIWKDNSEECDCARGTYCDNDTRYNRNYRYTFQTVWEIGGKDVKSADMLTRDVYIEKQPDSIDLRLVSVGTDRHCRVEWSGTGAGTLRIMALNRASEAVPDRVYTSRALARMGTPIIQGITVTANGYEWDADREQLYRLAAFRRFGDDWVAGRTITASTVPALVIDEANTSISNNTLNLRLLSIPENVSQVYYAVTNDGTVCTEQMAAMHELPAADGAYLRGGRAIIVERLQPVMLTVSLIAMYGSGENAYYSPVTKLEISNMPKKKIGYGIIWSTSGLFGAKRTRNEAELSVIIEGDRVPEMTLCCREDGHRIFNYSPDSPGIRKLIRIGAQNISGGSGKLYYSIPKKSMKGLPANSFIQLFLEPEEQSRYEQPTSIDANSLKLPEE